MRHSGRDQPAHPLRRQIGRRVRGDRAPVVADDRERIGAECIGQADHVLRQFFDPVAAADRAAARQIAAHAGGHGAKTGSGQRVEHRQIAIQRVREPVQTDHQRPLAAADVAQRHVTERGVLDQRRDGGIGDGCGHAES